MRNFFAHPPRGFAADRLADGTPAFNTRFDILTTADPALRRRVEGWPLYRHWRHWLHLQTRFVGSTVSEYAWLPPDANPAVLARTLRAAHASVCPLLIIKDIPFESPLLDSDSNAWASAFVDGCEQEGFVLVEGQALAWVPIDFASIDDYLTRLSRGRRRNIRRKLRSRAALQIETLATGMAFTDAAMIDEFYALYRHVYEQSELHFDFLERDFFRAALQDGDSGGIVFVYRLEGRLIGWNLCYEFAGMLVDKYIGLAYPEAREQNLYTVSWMENLEYARKRGLRCYVAGWSDPEVKAQLGARFTFTRHAVYPRNRMVRFALRRIAGRFESDRHWHEETLRHAAADP